MRLSDTPSPAEKPYACVTEGGKIAIVRATTAEQAAQRFGRRLHRQRCAQSPLLVRVAAERERGCTQYRLRGRTCRVEAISIIPEVPNDRR